MSKKRPKRHARPGVDPYGRSELHYAAREGDLARVEALIASGLDPSSADDDGWTPLHFAAQAHSLATCEALLRAGAAVDVHDSFGNSPLWRATFESRGRGEVIALLLRHGADPDLSNRSGVSPVRLARTIANYDVARHFVEVPMDDHEVSSPHSADTPEAYAELVRRNIRKHGFHSTWVWADEKPSWCYSTGIYETHGLPELIISSLPSNLSASLVRAYASRFRDNAPPIATRIARQAEDRFDYYLIRADPERVREYVLATHTYYGGAAVPYLQLIYPDTRGLFPHDPGYDYDQELFGDYSSIAPLP
jgi:hypothetical protein